MKLTKTEKNIFDYCKANSANITEVKIEELADETFTTAATISKMVKKMGFPNYYEFKLFFKTQFSGIGEVTKLDTFSGEYVNQFIKSLVSLDFPSIENWAKQFDKSKSIVLHGMGSSGYACRYFRDNLLRMGYNCIYVSEYFVEARYAHIYNNPMIICISNSAVTHIIDQFLNLIPDNADLYFITSNKEMDNGKNIVYNDLPLSNTMFSNNSLIIQIAILDHLLHELSKNDSSIAKFNSIH